ncbi:type II toxin-antitoxin system HicB family antitoxin [Olsenella profusa]|uniref:Type II toxin-antitoxin system HicB family antitoxin n=1 Tax=Olsenella profusa TaxID=138595 RepID=A0ABS2F0M5_9ACTN|nr:type II toxin-antitoxin system HicB family antitoxin [Olsenella profusa]MBM6774526.1 type II toxin-antitoxin system HicB family antitoxin [Olsenella profusa]
MRVSYPGCFERNELGGYSVWFPDLPECHTDGDDLEDAANMAAEALELAVESYLDNGRRLLSWRPVSQGGEEAPCLR